MRWYYCYRLLHIAMTSYDFFHLGPDSGLLGKKKGKAIDHPDTVPTALGCASDTIDIYWYVVILVLQFSLVKAVMCDFAKLCIQILSTRASILNLNLTFRILPQLADVQIIANLIKYIQLEIIKGRKWPHHAAPCQVGASSSASCKCKQSDCRRSIWEALKALRLGP